jgi:tetratricopeptide (TPR) repeat protein
LLGGRRKEALRELNQAGRQANPDRLALARLYAATLEPDRALSALGRRVDENSSSSDDLALLGSLNLATGRYEAAAKAFHRALAARPGDPTLSFYRGVSLRLGAKGEDRHEAVTALDAACSRMPEGRMFQYELALARRSSDDWDGALQAIRRASEISTNASEVFRDQAEMMERAGDKTGAALSRAAAYRNLADPDRALKVLKPWIGDKPDPSALAATADAFNEKGDGAAARRHLDRLPPMDTLPVGALWETYRSCRAIARNNEALAALEQLRKLAPDEVKVRDEQADTLQTLGKYAESEVIMRELKQLDPQNPYRPYQLGMHLVLWSQDPNAKVEAENEYREAIRISPGFAGPRYRLGMLLLEAKQPKQAIVQFRRALGISPRFSDALRGLARAYDAAGEKTLAEEAYRLQRVAAQRDALIQRLKRRDKHQRVSVQNRRALVKVYLEGNEPEPALSHLEVIEHLGASTPDERQLLMRLYGLQRRYQRQHEVRRILSTRR